MQRMKKVINSNNHVGRKENSIITSSKKNKKQRIPKSDDLLYLNDASCTFIIKDKSLNTKQLGRYGTNAAKQINSLKFTKRNIVYNQ